MTDAGLVAVFDRTMGALKVVGLALMLGLTVLFGVVIGLVVGAHLGPVWGLFFFAGYLVCLGMSLTDRFRLRARGSRRL